MSAFTAEVGIIIAHLIVETRAVIVIRVVIENSVVIGPLAVIDAFSA